VVKEVNKMKANKKAVRIFEDAHISVKIKLSAFWVALMLLYIYADILGFYTPGVIEKVVSGKVGGVQITEGFLFVMAIWMAIPSVMVFLSLTLKAKANRLVNIVIGVISMVVLGATFFAGEVSSRYAFQAIVEGVLIASIVWHAWKWPRQHSLEATS
jgi:hypothetical protein